MKVLTGVKAMLAVAMAAVGLAAFAENPTITLNRVQQRYPWNGLVDIDFTVDLKGNNGNQYYVRLQAEVNEGGNIRTQTMGEFLDLAGLTNAVHGARRVTWNTALDYSGFLVKNAKVTAQLMRHGGDLSLTPYFCPWCYTVIDVSGGPDAKSYPHWNEYLANMEVSTNKFNTEEYKTNKIVLRRIQPGTFIMGSPADEYGREPNDYYNKETQHSVTLTESYYIGMFPITQKQWENVMGANPSEFKPAEGEEDPTVLAEKAACPVEKVSYRTIRGGSEDGINVSVLSNGVVGATSFLGILRDKTGLSDLDLPTGAQWEFAARAGTTTSTFFGNNVTNLLASVLDKYMWYVSNAHSMTHGVGQKIPNQWGLYDTLGNVWEACLDRVTFAPNDDWGEEAVTDPLRAVEKGYLELRGSSWTYDIRLQRSAIRLGNSGTGTETKSSGFRLSRHSPIADLHK